MPAVELAKIAALSALVALICVRLFDPLASASVGVLVFYLLCVRITKA